MSTQNGTGEGVVRSDGRVTRLSLPCGHEGPFETSHTARGRTHYKCPSCGRVFAEDPHAPLTEDKGCDHKGPIEFDPSAKSVMPYKCLTCGRTFHENPSVPEKRNCLKEADKIINGERQDSYGAPEDSFTIVAGYWNVFLATKLKALGMDVKDLLSPLDTTNMMVLFKQARKLGQKPSRDNYVDSCGYEAIGADRLSE